MILLVKYVLSGLTYIMRIFGGGLGWFGCCFGGLGVSMAPKIFTSI